MSINNIQEFRYSVTDVVFVDVGNIAIPDEYQDLFDKYCTEIDGFPVDTPLWRAWDSGYKNCMLPKDRHKAYTKSLLCSGDEKQINAAIEAMQRTLGSY